MILFQSYWHRCSGVRVASSARLWVLINLEEVPACKDGAPQSRTIGIDAARRYPSPGRKYRLPRGNPGVTNEHIVQRPRASQAMSARDQANWFETVVLDWELRDDLTDELPTNSIFTANVYKYPALARRSQRKISKLLLRCNQPSLCRAKPVISKPRAPSPPTQDHAEHPFARLLEVTTSSL